MSTTPAKLFVVFGASDPERQYAVQLLDDLQQQYGLDAAIQYGFAICNGKQVFASNAYQADSISVTPVLDKDATIFFFECGGDQLRKQFEQYKIVQLDHHLPTHYGYGKPPEDFLEASSLGQLIYELAKRKLLPRLWGYAGIANDSDCRRFKYDSYYQTWSVMVDSGEHDEGKYWVPIPKDYVLCAAADHCLGAAYRGECPGVWPQDLLYWRVKTRATFEDKSVDALLDDICRASKELQNAVSDGQPYADLRGRFIPELPEAAARLGIPFIAELTEKDGRKKVVLQVAPAKLVERFMAGEIIPGLKNVYGDSARGFAGGYL